ncbi:O-antigen ligase family protein [Natronomonas gomsonensis]|uniref:O-antigen ligase family protein n=1 Tax=Natronomonas gomsonensis TaxID=1046043 RepID=UPI00227A8085|nr:O-antigen ligase family protein [Natronomonas gomsonensis]MCY4732134.1 O-antigen ligase family protein [Natronomonas gomsonensis]
MSICSLVISAVTVYYSPNYIPFIEQYAGVHVRTLLHQSRIFGVAVNPNRLAILLIPGIVMSGLILAHNMMGRKYDKKTLVASVLSLVFGSFTLILTQSRTGLIALVCSISISVILLSYSECINMSKIIIIISMSICVFGLLLLFGVLPDRYEVLLKMQDLSTLAIRFEIWKELFGKYQSTLSSVIIGYGPNTLYFNEFGGTDGEWATIGFKYGVLGMISILLFYIGVTKHSIKNINSDTTINKLLGSVSIGLTTAAILYSITDQFFLNQRIISLYILIWAVQIRVDAKLDM